MPAGPGPLARGGFPSATLATLRPLAAGSARRNGPRQAGVLLSRSTRRSGEPPASPEGPRNPGELPCGAYPARPMCRGETGGAAKGRGVRAELSGREVKRRLAGAPQVERWSERPPSEDAEAGYDTPAQLRRTSGMGKRRSPGPLVRGGFPSAAFVTLRLLAAGSARRDSPGTSPDSSPGCGRGVSPPSPSTPPHRLGARVAAVSGRSPWERKGVESR